MTEQPICLSYPKSGRTWLRMITNTLNIDIEYSHLDTGADRKSWGKRYDELDNPSANRDKIVVVSMFYEFNKRQLPQLSEEQYRKYEANGLLPPTTLAEFVRSPRFGIEKTIVFNLACKDKLHAYHLCYEELSSDTYQQLINLLNYLEIERPANQIQKAVDENSFAAMRKREETGDIPSNMVGRLGPTDPSDPNSYKVRRGIVGGWQSEMDAGTQSYANELMEKYKYKI